MKKRDKRDFINKSMTKLEPMSGEPWVKLANGSELADWGKDHEISYNQMNRQMEKALFYRRAFDFLKSNEILGDYHEYGCHRGRTFRMALTEARRQNMSEMRFYAFDSFVGLPTTGAAEKKEWFEGALLTSENDFIGMVREHGIYVDRIEIVRGYYKDVLNKELRSQFEEIGIKVALATIDCDLYESAVPVFEFIEPLLQEGAILYIDDFFAGYRGSPLRGVSRAFLEFQSRSRWKFARHLDVGWWGRSYITYSGEGILPDDF